jgi:hypothetical protein
MKKEDFSRLEPFAPELTIKELVRIEGARRMANARPGA